MPQNERPGARGDEQAGPDNAEHFSLNYTPRQDKEVEAGLLAALSRRLFVLNYSLEEARQRYADRRQFLRHAAACLILAMLRLCGWRYV